MARDTTDDTSLGNLSHWEVTQDLSLNFLRTYVDGSLALRDTSIGYLKTFVDGSLALRDTSLGNLSHLEIAQDASIVLKSNLSYVDSSLAARLHIYAGTFGGLKDASGANGDAVYDDSGSALYLKLSGDWLKIDASIHSFG